MEPLKMQLQRNGMEDKDIFNRNSGFFKDQYPEALLVNLRTDLKRQRMKCLMPGEERRSLKIT